MRIYLVLGLIIHANSLHAMHQPKRIADTDNGHHFLFKRVRAVPAPLPSLVASQETLIEEVPVSFECRYFGKNYCQSRFVNEQDEWQHIIQFHGIIAARYDYP